MEKEMQSMKLASKEQQDKEKADRTKSNKEIKDLGDKVESLNSMRKFH